MSEQFSDQYWMEKALNYANEAAAINEIPVGAVLVKDNQLISYGYNRS
ncbi:MAG: deaminase, partial [Pseudoalteromonas shioyasakiensis]